MAATQRQRGPLSHVVDALRIDNHQLLVDTLRCDPRYPSNVSSDDRRRLPHVYNAADAAAGDLHPSAMDDAVGLPSSVSTFSSSSRKGGKKKRKWAGTDTTTITSDDKIAAAATTNRDNNIFDGIILAISTDNKHHQSESSSDNHHSTAEKSSCVVLSGSNNDNNQELNTQFKHYNNLKSLKTILQSSGATISPQVHKRVHYLICTSSAINNLTQKIRQAIKRNVIIVSVDWIKECILQNCRVDVTPYLCNEVVRKIIFEKKEETRKTKKKGCEEMMRSSSKNDESNNSDSKKTSNSNNVIDDDNGDCWSKPVPLDCCCVCHENGDNNCPWCSECNINIDNKVKRESI